MQASPQRPTPSVYAVAWGFYLLLAAAGLVWLGLQRGRLELPLFVDPAAWPVDFGLGLAAGAAMAGLWAAAGRVLAAARRLERELAELLGEIGPDEAIALALISGLAEEVFFRGAVLQQWGWIAATLLFALLHLGGGRSFRLWAAFAVLAGLVLAGLVLWRGNLLPAILAHATVNAVGLLRLGRGGAASDDDGA